MPILIPLLFLLALAGHVALFVLPINLLYGTRFRGWWVSLIRWTCKGTIALGPIVVVVLYGPRWLEAPHAWPELPGWLVAYAVLCWALAAAVLYQTFVRLRRRTPVHQHANHTQTIDFARELGRRPYGRGRGWWLARFPLNQIFQVDFVQKTLSPPNLPQAWDGLTVLHLSDLHLCGIPDLDFYARVMERCAAEPPDLVAITGDILDSDEHYHWLAPVLGKLRWKLAAFAVLGNHDSWLDVPRIQKELEALGIIHVGGRWLQTEVRGEALIVVGNEVPWLGDAPDLGSAPSDVFRLGLSHSPDQLPWAKRNGIDLMLVGHNHGGQVRLPLLGPVLVPSVYSRRYDCGLFCDAPTLMYVSRGLGGTYPLRWNCRPEVTRVVLRRRLESPLIRG